MSKIHNSLDSVINNCHEINLNTEKNLIIYHGTDHIIEVPVYGKGKKANDFGLGFYCTESEQLSKEWASSPNCVGYSNKYVININHLNIMRLSDKK